MNDGNVTDDKFTPRERGLLAGHGWMHDHGPASADELEQVLNGEITRDLGDRVISAELRERLEASESANADVEFWIGFIDAVRTYNVQI